MISDRERKVRLFLLQPFISDDISKVNHFKLFPCYLLKYAYDIIFTAGMLKAGFKKT